MKFKINLVFFAVISVTCTIETAKAQIVQPNAIKNKHEFDVPQKVGVNPLKLKEVDDIRKEIKDAVAGNKYFVKSQHFPGKTNEDTILGSTKDSDHVENGHQVSEPILVLSNPHPPEKENNSLIGRQDSGKKEKGRKISVNKSINDSITHALVGNTESTKTSNVEIKLENESNSAKGHMKNFTESGNAQKEVKVPVKIESESNRLKEGPVVQPKWSEGDPNQKSSTNVKVTPEKLEETAKIREEIQEAVNEGTHVISSPGGNDIIHEVDEYYQHRYRLRQFLSNLLGSEVGEFDEYEKNSSEIDGLSSVTVNSTDRRNNSTENVTTPDIVPNIVDSQIIKELSEEDGDGDSLSDYDIFSFDFSPLSSEVLSIKAIEEDFSFSFGAGIKMWKVVENKGRTVVVGASGSNLTFLHRSDSGEFQKLNTVILDKIIVDFEIFVQWNSISKISEEIVIIAFKDQIICMEANTYEVITEWAIGRPVTGTKYYRVDNKSFLAVLTNPLSEGGLPSINIYQFDLINKDFWLSQVIPLELPCSEVIFLDTGRDIVLAVPQVNSTIIFTYNPAMQNEAHFQRVFVIESEGVQSISGFQMGGFSYIAIGGAKPKILRYHRGTFFPQTIFGQSFQLVERFISIPARTYRDDLILLVQHRISFETHSLIVVETLIWDGKAFQSSPSVPCIVVNDSLKLGASCLIDLERDDGIKGAAVTSNRGDISFIVPRTDGPSGLFRIEIELTERNAVKELDQAYNFLKTLAEEQEAVVSEAQNYIQQQPIESHLVFDYLESPEFSFNGEIDHIFINDEEWTEEDAAINITAFVDLLEETEKEIRLLENEILTDEKMKEDRSNKNISTDNDPELSQSRQKRNTVHQDVLEVDSISAENLLVEQINGVPVEEILFLEDNNLKFNGTVIIEGNLEMKNTVSSEESRIPLRENVLTVHSLEIDGDLKFERINGVPWKDIISGVVLANMPDDLEDLTVEEDIIFKSGLYISTLNGLNFPDDYLLSSGPESSVVQAKKKFHNNLTASIVDIGGDINDINPSDMITLSDNQWIPGRTTFTDLEVTEMLEITGSISGDGLDQFMPNPNLLHSTQIDSNCEFNQLEVHGPVIISDQLNDANLDEIFDDIVYKTEDSVFISATKTIKMATFEKPIEIREEIISNIHLDEFVTMDTDQEMNINAMSGSIYFNLLELKGLFDLVNVTELNENSIKLYGDEDTGAELVFENSGFFRTNGFEVLNFLNKESVNNFRTVFDNIDLEKAKFEYLSAESVTSNSDITGSGVLNNIDLIEFDKNRLSSTLNQNIIADVTIDTILVENDFNIKLMNGFPADFLLGFLEGLDNLPHMIQTGKVKLDSLHVLGNITVNTLNRMQFEEEIQNRVIWLNRPNFIRNELKFLDPIVVDGDLVFEGFVNNEHFSTFLNDIVFKTDEEIVITGPKKFISQMRVLEDTKIYKINNIPMSEIATKSNAKFEGSLHITGNLMIDNLQLGYYLNEYDVSDFLDLVKYDDESETFILTKEVVFKGQPAVEDLHVQGSVSGIGYLEDFFNNLVYKDKSAEVTGRKVFKNALNFQSGIFVDSLNGLNLTSYLNNIVYVNQANEVRIESPVIFTGPVEATMTEVQDVLHTSNIMGCDPYEWIVNGLRTDLPMDIHAEIQFERGSLDFNSLSVLHANGIRMTDIISLHIPQNISGPFYFSDVYLDATLTVREKINGVDLLLESKNTLMVNGNQHITAPTSMQFARVLRNLDIQTCVDGKDLNNLATLTGDLQLKSPLSFKDVIVKNVISYDLISGLNFTTWYQNSLWTSGLDSQMVTGNWTAEYIEIEDVMSGNGLINGVSVEDIRAQVEDMNPEKLAFFKELEIEKKKLCFKTLNLVKGTNRRVYFFKYFNKSFKIVEDGPINRLIIFMDGNEAYLMINVFCYSSIYRWNLNEFTKVNGMETGVIEEILAIPASGGGVRIVTTAASNNLECSISGTNIWFLASDQLNLLKDYDYIRDYSTIHYSPEQLEMFYGIDEKNNLVVEVDLATNNMRSWNLPSHDENNFRFLPHNAEMGVALSNGQSLLVISTQKLRKSRKRRYLTSKVLGNVAPDSLEHASNKTTVDSIFPPRPYDKGHNGGEIENNNKSKLVDDVEEVLICLIKDLNQGVELQGDLDLKEKDGTEELKFIMSKFKGAIDEMIRNNITLKGFDRNSAILSDENITNLTSSIDRGHSTSDLNTAKRLLRAFLRVKDIQIIVNKNNYASKWKDSEMVGGESPINFESILTILANSFTDFYNIFLRRRDDLLGSSLGSQNYSTGGRSDFAKEKIESIVKNLESELTSLNEVLNADKELIEVEERRYGFNEAKEFKKLKQELPDNWREENSPKPSDNMKEILAKLSNDLREDISYGNDLNLQISDEDHKYITEKFKQFVEEITKKNISLGEPAINLTVLPGLKHNQVSSSALSAAKKLLNATLLIIDHKNRQSHSDKKKNSEMVGLESPLTFEGILTILAGGFTDLYNILIMRRDDFLGSPLGSDNNMSLDNNSDVVRDKITSIIKNIEDELKVLKVTDENSKVEPGFEDKQLQTFRENFSSGTISTHWSSVNATVSELDESFKNTTTPSSAYLPDSVEAFLHPTPIPPPVSEYFEEPIIAYDIPDQDLLVAYNDYLPGKSSGEVLALKVGSPRNRKSLIAVTHSKQHYIAGQHDSVKLYHDIEQGYLFQRISSFKPRSLTALHMRDETLLAFVEDKHVIRVFAYRGIEGFVEVIKIKSNQPVTILTSASLPGGGKTHTSCLRHFLIVATANYTQFYEAKMAGECGLDLELSCGG